MDNSTRNIKLKEQISALVDGECESHELELIISELQAKQCRQEWEIYHQIGDILNSRELSISLSSEFAAKMQARIDAEPIYLHPPQKKSHFNPKVAYAVAAMVALLTVLVPQFAGHDGAEVDAPYRAAQFLSATSGAPSIIATDTTSATRPFSGTRADAEIQVLRDPLIDSYLAAHQRYSNPMYSEVEYETGPINQEADKQ